VASWKIFKYSDGATGYNIRYYLRGKRFEERIPKGLSPSRRKWLKAEFEKRIKDDQLGIASFISPLKKSQSTLTINDFLYWFLHNKKIAKRRGRPVSDRTMYSYRYSYERIFEVISPSTPISDLPKLIPIIEDFLSSKYVANSISIIVRNLRWSFNFGIQKNILTENPFLQIPITEEESDPGFWTPEEMDLIFEKIENVEAQKGFICARYNGLRKIEICRNIKWELLYFGSRYGIIPEAKTGTDQRFEMLPQFIVKIEPYRQDHGFVCDIDYSNLDGHIRKARIAAGIKKAGAVKILRHSLAHNLLIQGCSVVFVQRILRQKDIRTTMRYLNFLPAEIREKVEGFKL